MLTTEQEAKPEQQVVIAEPEKSGPKLGIFTDISNMEYHGGPGISKSGLDLINLSPLHYITNKRHPKSSTEAMFFGTAFHTIVLEPDVFNAEYVKTPDAAPKRPTSAQLNAKKQSAAAIKSITYWEKFDTDNTGKIIITNKAGDDPFWKPGMWDQLHLMRDAILAHPVASILLDLDQGVAEQSVYWIDKETGKLCKCRPDFVNDVHNIAIDLKSALDASFTGFAKSCANFRYHVQSPFYLDGLYNAGRKIDSFVFVAVEKSPPWAVGIYVLDKEAIRIGRIQYQRDLEVYAQCHKEQVWPSYPEEIRDLVLPAWGLRGHIS